MRCDDRFGARSDGALDKVRIDAPGVGPDIDEDGRRAEVRDRRGRGDPVGVGEDDVVAVADAECGEAHMHGARATRCGQRVMRADMRLEGCLEAADVFVATLAPTKCGGVGRVTNFQVRDRRLRVENARRHVTLSEGKAVTVRVRPSRRGAAAALISSSMFQGSTSRKSGRHCRSWDGGTIGTWLPGMYLPCFAVAASQTKATRSALTPA